ncbi:hypothetical protein D7294_00175 [Streptomyces hoynatensis]|uniref:DUF2384 domain-containing protein n=2 Tax=Streptomyces hoynatensis TaxID=1141874 RepID=A0A3A9ZJ30_9ACTN|nr:hypothetical protein D7294_00175 [Streptomyces hoynatensis]
MLELVGERLAEIRAGLPPEEFERFRLALDELAAAGADAVAARRAALGIGRALLSLPLDSPLRAAVADRPRLATGAGDAPTLVAERAREVLRRLAAQAPSPEEIVARARRRLLAAPARSEAELDPRTAADPLAAGLIRLTDAERGARYPDFQFDPGGGPRPVVRRVNRMLLAEQDPWGAADWWLGANRWLGGVPAELIGRVPDELLAEAAQVLVEGEC